LEKLLAASLLVNEVELGAKEKTQATIAAIPF
jgi:hypothetical protein